jgi:hypothetical protein
MASNRSESRGISPLSGFQSWPKSESPCPMAPNRTSDTRNTQWANAAKEENQEPEPKSLTFDRHVHVYVRLYPTRGSGV